MKHVTEAPKFLLIPRYSLICFPYLFYLPFILKSSHLSLFSLHPPLFPYLLPVILTQYNTSLSLRYVIPPFPSLLTYSPLLPFFPLYLSLPPLPSPFPPLPFQLHLATYSPSSSPLIIPSPYLLPLAPFFLPLPAAHLNTSTGKGTARYAKRGQVDNCVAWRSTIIR